MTALTSIHATSPDQESAPATAPGPSWSFRKPTPAEVADIIAQWTSSYRNSPWAGTVPNNVYATVQTELIRQLLTRGAVLVVTGDPMIAWACLERTRRDEPVVHYVYTLPAHRRTGAATALLAGYEAALYTHRTVHTDRVLARGRYVPQIARRKEA